MSELPHPDVNTATIRDINQRRTALKTEGFEFECDQPNTPKGRALIISHEAALKVMGWRTQIVKAVTLIDLWKKEGSQK